MSIKVKTFFHVLVNSLLPNVKYYHKIIHTKFFFSFKYYFYLIILLNLIFVGTLIINYSPNKISRTLDSINFNLNKLPKNFFIKIENGTLITSLNRPFFLWLDYQNNKKLLSVVDESATPNKINEYNSFILVTPRELVFKNNKNNQELPIIIPLNYVDNIEINQNTLAEIKQSIVDFKNSLLIIYIVALIILSILLSIISFITISIYLLIANIFCFIFNRIFLKKKIKLKKIIQISFHSATLPLIIDYTLTIFHFKSSSIPCLFIFTLIMFNLTAMYEAYFDEEKEK